MQLYHCHFPVLRVSSDFGPAAHFVSSCEDIDSYAKDGVIDEEAHGEICRHAVELYKSFLTALNQGVLVKARWDHHNMSDFQRMSSGWYVLSRTTSIEYVHDFPHSIRHY
ncbi:MAG: hypothetical protein HQ515_13490 [Phycisphaeraceae bacterium]|nr:hypothetical protein [Phycisphaeraceae bacterium]